MKGKLEFSSLGEQVYKYLRRQMYNGDLVPGSTINLGAIAAQLGISKTPLRDALIQMEVEGFVTILPRKGVLVNKLGAGDVKNAYETVGLIEAFLLKDIFDRLEAEHLAKLEELNEKMRRAVSDENFTGFFKMNLDFHNVYLDISGNELLKKFILPIKHRLYDFPRQKYISEWESANIKEHDLIITALKAGDADEAASLLRDRHWSYEYQKDFILKFYGFEE